MFTTICSSHSLFCRLSFANTTIIKSFCNTVLVVRYMHNSVIQDFIPQILKTAIFIFVDIDNLRKRSFEESRCVIKTSKTRITITLGFLIKYCVLSYLFFCYRKILHDQTFELFFRNAICRSKNREALIYKASLEPHIIPDCRSQLFAGEIVVHHAAVAEAQHEHAALAAELVLPDGVKPEA